MKLLTKANNYYLTFLLFIAPIMIAVDYCLIRHFVHTEVNEILVHEGERIKHYLNTEKEFPPSNYILETTLVKEAVPPISQFRDTLIYDAYTNEKVAYRKYDFLVTIDDATVKVSLKHVLWGVEELITWIFVSTAFILVLMVVGLFLINKKISKWAWKPFFQNLSKLEHYDITQKNKIHLEDSSITEFKALYQVINTLMNQVEKVFKNLKEFNENISHEMQTPLAIIRNKMVLLLESQNLSEKELQWVQAAYQEVNKLSKTGKSLTLISRIENQEFTRLENVDILATIDNIISNMEDIIQFKSLKTSTKLEPVRMMCDPILANILFTNLIKNAVQHNLEGGYIRMQLSNNKFEIENTGEVLKTDTAPLFNRFQKGNTATDNLGLGLAISQKICELYGFQLNYDHHEGKHTFSLLFDN